MPDYPRQLLEKWQLLMNGIGLSHNLPSVLLTQVDRHELEIFVKGGIDENHFELGERLKLSEFYCNSVVEKGSMLRIPNAAKHRKWKKKLDVTRGMLAYLGFPIYHPNGKVLGTLCVLDKKENHFGKELEHKLKSLKSYIEHDLWHLSGYPDRQKKLEKAILGEKQPSDEKLTGHSESNLMETGTVIPQEKYKYLLSEMESAYVLFEAIFNEQGDFVDARYLEMNAKNEELLGFAPNEAIGKTVLEIFPETPREWFDRLLPVLNRQCGLLDELRVEPTGKYCLTNVVPVDNRKFAFIAHDLSGTFALQKKVELAENRYRSLLNKMNSAFVIFEVIKNVNGEISDVKFIDLNTRIEKYAGIRSGDVVGKKISDVFQGIDPEWYQELQPLVMEGKAVEFKKYFKPLNFYLSVKAFPFEGNTIALIIQDITNTIQLQKQLSDMEYRYKTLFSEMDAGFVIYDAVLDEGGLLKDFRHVDMNKKMEEYIGLSAQEVQGKTILELFPATRKIWFDKTEAVVYKQQVVNFELKHEPLNKYFFCSAFSLAKNRIAVISHDITEKELLKEELVKSEQKYRALFHENTSVEMLMNASDGALTDVNEAAVHFYGYSREKLLSMNISDITTRNREGVEDYLERIAAGELKYFDSHHILSSGEIKDVVLYSDRLYIDGSLQLHFIIHDVSEAKKIARENQKLLLAIEQSPAAITITDLQGNIEYVNPKKIELSSYSKAELIGKNPRIFKSGKTSRTEYKELWKTLLRGDKWVGEFYNRKKDGSFFWEQASIAPIKNEEGEIVNFLKIAKDITEQKKLEIELINAKLRAEESDRLKSAFLANLSHEVRTPLNAIMGFTSLLFDDQGEVEAQKQKEFAKIIQSAGDQLTNIIDDLMDVSMIEAGKLVLKESLFSLNELTHEVEQMNKLLIEDLGKSIVISSKACCDVKIKSDRDRIGQVLNNLVKNAIKFTDKGKVQLSFQCQHGSISFSVEDTGIGISQEDQAIIFDRFRKVDREADVLYGGNGLGLAICKDIVDQMGGEIWVESELGKGSKFSFTVIIDEIYNLNNELVKSFKPED